MSLHVFVGRTQTRKTYEAKRRALSRIPVLMYSPPQVRQKDALWPVYTVDQLRAEQLRHGRGLHRVVLNADCDAFLDVLAPAAEAGVLRGVVLDEVHDFFDDDPTTKRLKKILRQHRHADAEWYACTQRFVRVSELLGVLDTLTIGGLLTEHDARVARGYNWPGRRETDGPSAFPGWTSKLGFDEIVLDPRMCRSLIECDTREGRLRWLQCDCRNHRDKNGKVLSCSAP